MPTNSIIMILSVQEYFTLTLRVHLDDIYGKAHYNLEEIKELLKVSGTRVITDSSMTTAVGLGYSSRGDVVQRVLKVKPSDIYKNMASDKVPGLRQDVYKSTEDGNTLYIKVQKSKTGKGIVISFKTWG